MISIKVRAQFRSSAEGHQAGRDIAEALGNTAQRQQVEAVRGSSQRAIAAADPGAKSHVVCLIFAFFFYRNSIFCLETFSLHAEKSASARHFFRLPP